MQCHIKYKSPIEHYATFLLQLALKLWKDNIVEPLKKRLVEETLVEISKNRLGEIIKEHDVRTVVHSLVTIEKYNKKNPLEVNVFLLVFLKRKCFLVFFVFVCCCGFKSDVTIHREYSENVYYLKELLTRRQFFQCRFQNLFLIFFLQLYETLFEKKFLAQTDDYYEVKANDLLVNSTCSEYMKQVPSVIAWLPHA